MDVDNQTPRRTYAVLVDADNVSADVLQDVLAEVTNEGHARFKLMVGHLEALKGHKESANTHGFRPIVQFNVAQGKNAADISLVIEAMKLLHAGAADAFCIVASDSDYQPLVLHLAEAGKHVLGIGREDTPVPFKRACSRFVSFEALAQGRAPKSGSSSKTSKPQPAPAQPAKPIDEFRSLFARAMQVTQGENGLAPLALVGSQLRVLDPGFDHRQYGRKSLSALVQEAGGELVPPPPVPSGQTQFVRLKQ